MLTFWHPPRPHGYSLCPTGLSRHLYFLYYGTLILRASEFPNVKNYKWRLNPVWHRMLYSFIHVATVGVKRLSVFGLRLAKFDDIKLALRIQCCQLPDSSTDRHHDRCSNCKWQVYSYGTAAPSACAENKPAYDGCCKKALNADGGVRSEIGNPPPPVPKAPASWEATSGDGVHL